MEDEPVSQSSASPQPMEGHGSIKLPPFTCDSQQPTSGRNDTLAPDPLPASDAGDEYQSTSSSPRGHRDLSTTESDSSSMLSYVTLKSTSTTPVTAREGGPTTPPLESYELLETLTRDTQHPIGMPNRRASSAEEACDDLRWHEWREWREWKMQQEWQEFRKWEEGRKRTGVPVAQNANTGQQRAESAEQAQPAQTQAVDDSPVRYEKAEENGGVRTEYVLSGQPTGWAAIDKVLRDYDEEKVQYCKEDIDTVLVFAGLFSAVLTAFLIESYQNLTNNGSSNSGSSGNSSTLQQLDAQSSSTASPFQPSSVDIRVNVLWFASLLFSLIAASFGILVKQWLREYMAVQNPSPQARLRVRHLRYPQLAKWKVFEIAAVLPLLLQLSLSLFFIGLCYFTAAVHSSIGHTTLPLVITWAVCFMVAAILPLFYPRCPFRITLLKVAISRVHRGCVNIAQQARLQLLRSWQSPLHDDSAKDELTEQDSIQADQGTDRPPEQDLLQADQSKDEYINSAPLWRPTKIVYSILWPVVDLLTTSDEDEVVQRADHDLSILAAADAVQSNDEILSTSIVEAVKQIERKSYSGEQFLAFFHRVLANRLVIPEYQGPDHEHTYRLCIDLRTTSLPSRSREAVLDIVYSYLRLTYQESRSLNPRDDFSPSDAILIVLYLTSGRSIYDIPYLIATLGQDKSLPALAQACRGILLAPADDAYSQTLLINAMEGILRLCRGLGANWTAISFLYQILALDRDPYSHPFHPLDEISSTFEKSDPQSITYQLEVTGSKFFTRPAESGI